MKYIYFVVLLVGLGGGLFHGIEEYKNVFLIEDTWEISEGEIGKDFVLAQKIDGDFQYYHFFKSSGFIDITKRFGVMWALLLGVILILLPFVIYIFKMHWNSELLAAEKVKKEAQEASSKADIDLINYKRTYKKECDLKVQRAYDTQLKIVQVELENEFTSLKNKQILVDQQFVIAKNKETEAAAELVKFDKLKADFEFKEAAFTKSRHNAVATTIRRKKKQDKDNLKINDFLNKL